MQRGASGTGAADAAAADAYRQESYFAELLGYRCVSVEMASACEDEHIMGTMQKAFYRAGEEGRDAVGITTPACDCGL